MAPDSQNSSCWVVTDGKAGMENQALGLAEALGMNVSTKRISLRTPWRQGAPFLRWGLSYCLSSKSDPLTPPWPQLIIASGRPSILPALWVKRASQGKTAIVYIQNPVISPKHFDLVVAPAHDNLSGSNVVVTNGALHRVTSARLAEEKLKFPQFESLPSPRVAVLLGGSNRVYQLDAEAMQNIAAQLKDLQKNDNVSLLISPSRRTGEQNLTILQTALADLKNCTIWDGQSENPYFALLAWADAILVTCESVCMISEAYSTTKPVYLIPLQGGDQKFRQFHQHVVSSGRVEWFQGRLNAFDEKPAVNETTLVAQRVHDLLKSRGI